MRREVVFLVLALLILPFMGSAAASACIDCHSGVTPKIVEDFRSGAMGDDVDCSDCHGSVHNSVDTVDMVKMFQSGFHSKSNFLG
ncbi:hypothetical protein C4E24_06980 [ANME-1 cluster archaeon AG-394-G21]|nr:hypothetical protein [ANME-1 cluster archaeon AG-394-G21]